MPKIRLNKATKEFNISIPRAIEFLQAKGFNIAEGNPNVLLEDDAYMALEAEFAVDGKQKRAQYGQNRRRGKHRLFKKIYTAYEGQVFCFIGEDF